MPTAKNMKALKNMLLAELAAAMYEAKLKSLDALKDGTDYFYEGTSPKMYKRTGKLGNTPSVTNVDLRSTGSSMSASFNAYLDASGGYTTGKKPSMKSVLELANYGISPTEPDHLRATVGNRGFWEKSEENIEQILNETIAKHFG